MLDSFAYRHLWAADSWDPEELPRYTGAIDLQRPFAHQVAGHDPFVMANDDLLCKPLIAREFVLFVQMQSESPTLRAFLPPILGCITIAGSVLHSLESSLLPLVEAELAPWALRMHRKLLSTPSSAVPSNYYFLVMRDLTAPYRKPCVMDLKIGTRQHGDDASNAKRLHQIEKCNITTSSRLGLRICGHQVYDSDAKSFRYFDKYQGRKLTSDKFIAGMRSFFCTTDNILRASIVRRFLDRVRELYNIHKTDHPYRMYSSSLLFVYEGQPLDTAATNSNNTASTPNGTKACDGAASLAVADSLDCADYPARIDGIVGDGSGSDHIELRMIDFAHTHRLESGHAQDDGYLYGLENLIQTLEIILEQEYQH